MTSTGSSPTLAIARIALASSALAAGLVGACGASRASLREAHDGGPAVAASDGAGSTTDAGTGTAEPELNDVARPPGALTKRDVLPVVKANIADVERCGREHGQRGVVMMRWKIGIDGRPFEIRVDDRHPRTPATECVVTEIATWTFPASAFVTPVSFPMKLGG